jgi:di/tripeptidase
MGRAGLMMPHSGGGSRPATPGADNGIGMALALAALEDETLRHGPLKVLLTVNEEAGMRGGHSGCDIHLQRGNANRLLAQALQALEAELGAAVRLIALSGGSARNALPREARALLALPASDRTQKCSQNAEPKLPCVSLGKLGFLGKELKFSLTGAAGRQVACLSFEFWPAGSLAHRPV